MEKPSLIQNVHWFLSPDDARDKIERWRIDFNRYRPHHRSQGDMTPLRSSVTSTLRPEFSSCGCPGKGRGPMKNVAYLNVGNTRARSVTVVLLVEDRQGSTVNAWLFVTQRALVFPAQFVLASKTKDLLLKSKQGVLFFILYSNVDCQRWWFCWGKWF